VIKTLFFLDNAMHKHTGSMEVVDLTAAQYLHRAGTLISSAEPLSPKIQSNAIENSISPFLHKQFLLLYKKYNTVLPQLKS